MLSLMRTKSCLKRCPQRKLSITMNVQTNEISARGQSGQCNKLQILKKPNSNTSLNFKQKMWSSYFSNLSTNIRKPQILNKSTTRQVLEKYDTILLDCDGVLWSVDHYTKFDRIAESMDKLRKLNENVLFVTNNSMHARVAYIEKFRNYGGFDADKNDIFAVSYVSAFYLKEILNITGKCYLVGNQGMKTELENVGINHVGYGPDKEEASDQVDILLNHTIHDDVEAVLVGFDHHFSYNKLYKATSYLMNMDCHYVATNDVEMAVKIGPKHKQPITGAIVASVSAASKRKPLTIGKPHNHLLECIKLEKPSLKLETTIMIGDSLYSDIHFANNSGIDSILVLTGASDMNSVTEALSKKHDFKIPKYILPQFNDLSIFL